MCSFRVSFVLLMAGTFLLWQCKGKSPEQVIINPPPAKVDTVIAPVIEDIPLARAVDSICVVKHQRRMYVYNTGQLLKVYQISLGTTPVGAKHFQGDRKTPEGQYYINGKNPNSMAHKNLGISYPNERDRQYARKIGKAIGGDVKIHGMVNGWEASEQEYRNTDWTWGCIAVLNKDIDELYEYVAMGAPIFIVP